MNAAHSHGGLPPDNHVHTQFSYDTEGGGSMVASCERAIQLGLPSIAFTEHLDFTAWVFPKEAADRLPPSIGEHWHDGCLKAPDFNFDGYFEEIEKCRSRFGSELRILSGLELGEPHWFAAEVTETLARGSFDRLLGSLHTAEVDGARRLIDEWFQTEAIEGEAEAEGMRAYLAEVISVVGGSDVFEVFTHIDYLVRQIERAGRTHDVGEFEDEYRQTLRAIADADRILEINTRRQLDPRVVGWWREEGGKAVSFGSDAHEGGKVGSGFAEAAAMAETAGFRRQADPLDFWRRS